MNVQIVKVLTSTIGHSGVCNVFIWFLLLIHTAEHTWRRNPLRHGLGGYAVTNVWCFRF